MKKSDTIVRQRMVQERSLWAVSRRHLNRDLKDGMEPACEDAASTKAGRWAWAEPDQGTKGGLCGQSPWAGEALGKMQLDKEQRPDKGRPPPVMVRSLDFFYGRAKESRGRVSGRQKTRVDWLLKVRHLRWTEEKRRNPLFLWAEWDKKAISPPIHLTHTTSNCGWYPPRDLLWDIACN